MPKLYCFDSSPPSRAVYLTAEILGIDLERVEVDVTKLEQLKPEFLKLNPQHTIPVLDDDGKIIWDSHAIMIYLVTKYGKNHSLYPEDPFTRAVIHQRLHFESGVALPAVRRIVVPMILGTCNTISSTSVDDVRVVYEFLDKFLEGRKWVASDFITLADLSLLPTITSLDCLVPINEQYKNILNWIKRAEELTYYHINKKGLVMFNDGIKNIINSS